MVYKRQARSPPRISSGGSKNLTFDNKNVLGCSLSENNLLANFKKISKELNDNSLSLYMKKSYDAEEIVISNSGHDDENFDNFFIAVGEQDEQNVSGIFQVKEVFTEDNSAAF